MYFYKNKNSHFNLPKKTPQYSVDSVLIFIFYLLICLFWVLAGAHRIFDLLVVTFGISSCSMWDLFP